MWLPKMADNLCKSYFRSQCAAWVENCELLSGGNGWELTVILTLQDEQFRRGGWKKGISRTTSITTKCSWTFSFITLSATWVNFAGLSNKKSSRSGLTTISMYYNRCTLNHTILTLVNACDGRHRLRQNHYAYLRCPTFNC